MIMISTMKRMKVIVMVRSKLIIVVANFENIHDENHVAYDHHDNTDDKSDVCLAKLSCWPRIRFAKSSVT